MLQKTSFRFQTRYFMSHEYVTLQKKMEEKYLSIHYYSIFFPFLSRRCDTHKISLFLPYHMSRFPDMLLYFFSSEYNTMSPLCT